MDINENNTLSWLLIALAIAASVLGTTYTMHQIPTLLQLVQQLP